MNLHIMTLSITIKRWHKCSVEWHDYAKLNVIMLSVVMLSVLAPFERNKSRQLEFTKCPTIIISVGYYYLESGQLHDR